MARDQLSGRVDLPFAIEGAQQSRPDVLDRVRKGVQPIAAFAGQPREWHVEVAGEVDRHRPVEHSTGRLDPAILLLLVCPGSLQRLVNVWRMSNHEPTAALGIRGGGAGQPSWALNGRRWELRLEVRVYD
jgi:hypothetical protein